MRSSPLAFLLFTLAVPAAAQPLPGQPPGTDPAAPPAAMPAPSAPGEPPTFGHPAAPGQPAPGQPAAPIAPGQPAATPPGPPPPGTPPAPPAPWNPASQAGGATIPPPREDVHWFARVELGLGGPGMQENNNLLSDIGYARIKMWATLDFAYMFHRRVGAGLWMGMNRRSSQPGGQTLDLNAYSLFVGGELPVMIWGKRAYAFHVTPRLGYLNGTIDLANGIDAEAQHGPIFGGALSFQSFTYHVGASLGWMFAPVGSPGELGRNHDHGGIYAALGGTIDG